MSQSTTMSSNKMRFLSMIQNVRPKKEKLDDDDDAVICKLCAKGFASKMALMNHAKVEHIAEYVAGEDICVVKVGEPKQSKRSKAQQREAAKQRIKRKTEELISSMSPTDLMSFASPDVSYIIIKTEGDGEDGADGKRRRERTKRRERGGGERGAGSKDREPLPISGPFECLQPSTLVADGTCHQIFFSCCEYSTHYRDEHTRRRKGIRCQVCEKVLGVDWSGAPHACDTCGQGFDNVKDLSEHVSVAHVKLKPFQCVICHKRFTQKGGLQQHLRMHTGDRPYPCTVCPKAFTQKSGLEQHMRIHSKIRPYQCVICSKRFCQSIHLKQHMRTHTNVSPFQCGLCQKRFKQSSHLNYHLKYHNPANMTEEQRQKYEELMGLIKKPEMIEVEIDQNQLYEVVQEEEDTMEQVEQVEEEVQEMEQIEEMGQIEGVDQIQHEYILGDCIVEDVA